MESNNLLFIECTSESLYKSISHVLKRTLLKKQNGFIIKANNFAFLSTKSKLTPLQLLQMAECLHQQFLFLRDKERKGFVQLQKSFVLCIDENKFVYLNEDDMYDLDEGEKLLILSPFAKEEELQTFQSREVMELTLIPSLVNWDCILVALGFLLKSYNENKNIKSPLLYFIERCIEERKFLYI